MRYDVQTSTIRHIFTICFSIFNCSKVLVVLYVLFFCLILFSLYKSCPIF
uniref:Uncharacterized protein n=1 Tax=Anguilla anguilla TaxID=7936 RepID=A0A0E9UUQ5_ANGAN